MTLPSGRPASSFDDVRSPTLDDWEAWVLHIELRLWQAVALACEIEPSSLPAEGLWAHAPEGSTCKRFHGHYQAALSAVSAGMLKVKAPSKFPSSWSVAVADFVEWARRVGLELPPVLELAEDRPVAAQPSSVGGSWPWGDYETRLLRWVAVAVQRFWVNYDPSERSTAPTADVVVPWLLAHQEKMGEELSDREAKLIAQLVKADSVGPGPR